MKKNKTPEQQMFEFRMELVGEAAHWQTIRDYGCNDPFWTDGANMNLVRNHILSCKRQIMALHEETGEPLPGEYFVPTPPEVDNHYVASLRQRKRVERLRVYNGEFTMRKPVYDDTQMSF